MTYLEMLHLKRPSFLLKAYLCFTINSFEKLKEEKSVFLHPSELTYFNSLSFERRQKSYLQGRYCSKRALSAYLNEPDLSKIKIHRGVFEQPIVEYPSMHNIQISISHSDEWAGAIAFPEEHPMAIDLEKIDPEKKKVIQTQCAANELKLIESLAIADITKLTILWTVKEGLSKVLKCGFMSPFSIFEVQSVESHSEYFIWTFRNFAQYKAFSFVIGKTACSLIAPKKTEFSIQIKELKKQII
ncbi:MAG: 4'-phosphopantetheinyl transferase family protein [bacterium]